MKKKHLCVTLVFFCLIFISACSKKKYLMTLQFDPSDVSGVTVFSNKNNTSILLRITNNKVILLPDDIVGVGSLKVVFKSNKFGEVEYIDNFIAEGRKLNVSLDEGKVIIAVQDSGYY